MKSIDEFIPCVELGKGGFGSVWKMRHNDVWYAVKKISLTKLRHHHDRVFALNEFHILYNNRSPYLCSGYKAFFSKKYLYFILNWAQHGDLSDIIDHHKRCHRRIKQTFIWRTLCQLALAIKYLHVHFIIHRDVKPSNILIVSLRPDIQLADFGTSTMLGRYRKTSSTSVGTPYYMSPEVCKRPHIYSYAIDMWSCGCVLYELLTLRQPFQGSSLRELYRRIARGKYHPIQDTCTYEPALIRMLPQLITVHPARRVTSAVLVQRLRRRIAHENINNDVICKSSTLVKKPRVPWSKREWKRAMLAICKTKAADTLPAARDAPPATRTSTCAED